MKHLEESEIQKDIGEIKKHLLGKVRKIPGLTEVIYTGTENFVKKVNSLINDENVKELNKIVRALKRETIKRWKATKGQDKQTVQEIKELYLIPLINKLAYLALLVIENDFENEIKSTFVETIREIYELSLKEDLGYPTIEEWILANNSGPLKAKEHLTYTVPSKEIIKRIFIISAFVVRKKKFGELQDFCNLDVYIEKVDQILIQPLLFNPSYSFDSGEGSSTTSFDEARELMVQDKIIYQFFDQEMEESLDELVRADFLIGFIFFIQGKDDKIDNHIRYMNFPRLYVNRVAALIESMRIQPEILGHDFPKFTEEQLKNYVLKSINLSESYYWSIRSSWNHLDFKNIFGS